MAYTRIAAPAGAGSKDASRAQHRPACRLTAAPRPPAGAELLSTDVLCRAAGPNQRAQLTARPRFVEQADLGTYRPREALQGSLILGTQPCRKAPYPTPSASQPAADWEALDIASRFPWLSPPQDKDSRSERSPEPEQEEISCDCSTADTETGVLTNLGLPTAPSPEDLAKGLERGCLKLERQSSPGGSSLRDTSAQTSPRSRQEKPADKPLFLDLSRALDGAELGSPEMPTLGSIGHFLKKCKPCAFMYKGGCESGVQCQFCHLCEPGEKKRRKKENKALRKETRDMMFGGL